MFALIGVWFLLKNIFYDSMQFVLIFLAHVGAYTFFEVQARYHYPAVVFMLIIAAYGAEQSSNFIDVKIWRGKSNVGRAL